MRSSQVCTDGSCPATLIQRICFSEVVCCRVRQVQQLDPLLFSLVLHPLTRFRLTFLIWTCASGTWTMAPSLAAWATCTKCSAHSKRLGLHLNVKKNEIWWPCRAAPILSQLTLTEPTMQLRNF